MKFELSDVQVTALVEALEAQAMSLRRSAAKSRMKGIQALFVEAATSADQLRLELRRQEVANGKVKA